MEIKTVKEILRLVKPKFFEDFDVNVTVLAYFTSSNPPCLEGYESEELKSIKKPRERIDTFFELLAGRRNSVNLLISYFDEHGRGQQHLKDFIIETRDAVLAQQSATSVPTIVTDSANGNSMGEPVFVTSDQIDDLVDIIAQNGIVLQNWESVSCRILADEYNQTTIQDLLNVNKPKEAVVRKTLQLFVSEQQSPATLEDFLKRLKRYPALQGEIRKQLS